MEPKNQPGSLETPSSAIHSQELASTPQSRDIPTLAMGSSVPPIDRISSHSDESIEERCFSGCLICLEGHYSEAPAMGPLTAAKVTSMVSRTLEKTHAYKDVR